MIIFGSKATQVASETINEKCASCGTPNSIQMTVFQKYAHVFWIPSFPMGKTSITQCSHCKQVLEKKEFSRNLHTNYEILKSKSKTPIWTFSGIAIFTAFIIWGGFISKQKEELNANLILTPQKGDIYEVKLDRRQYTLYKVEKVSGDTVFILFHEYETNKKSGLRGLKNKGDAGFIEEEPLLILKKDLKNMLETGEIMDIER